MKTEVCRGTSDVAFYLLIELALIYGRDGGNVERKRTAVMDYKIYSILHTLVHFLLYIAVTEEVAIYFGYTKGTLWVHNGTFCKENRYFHINRGAFKNYKAGCNFFIEAV